MVYEDLSSSEIQVGKATKKELFQKVKDNFEDHEDRIAALEVSSSLVEIFDEDVWNAGAITSLTGLFYYKVKQALRITKVELQIYTKGAIASGTIELDVQKASELDPSFFSTILTATAEINFATAADYDSDEGVLDATQNQCDVGDFLRVDIPTLPATPVGKFRVVVYGEVSA